MNGANAAVSKIQMMKTSLRPRQWFALKYPQNSRSGPRGARVEGAPTLA
jgi:hypothetical protein